MHTSTVTRSHSFFEKQTTRTPRVHFVLYMASLLRFRQTFCTSLSSVEITFGTRLHDIYFAEYFQIRPRYQHRGYACLKEVSKFEL